jgi:hypothetical protein
MRSPVFFLFYSTNHKTALYVLNVTRKEGDTGFFLAMERKSREETVSGRNTFLDGDCPSGSIDGDVLSSDDALCSSCYTNDRWNAILAGDDCAMGRSQAIGPFTTPGTFRLYCLVHSGMI